MKTQKQRIIDYLKIGKKLTTLTAAMKGFGVKLPNRISEIERETKLKFNRVWKENKNSRWIEYSLKK